MRTYVRNVQQGRDDDHVFEACNRRIYEQGWSPSVTVGPITSHDYSSVPHVIGSAESTLCQVFFFRRVYDPSRHRRYITVRDFKRHSRALSQSGSGLYGPAHPAP